MVLRLTLLRDSAISFAVIDPTLDELEVGVNWEAAVRSFRQGQAAKRSVFVKIDGVWSEEIF